MFLKLDSVSVRYAGAGGRAAVEGVSLGLAEGQIGVLIGPSGCGKTTLLRCIAGLERTAAGSVGMAGRVLSDAASGVQLSPEQRRIGMITTARYYTPGGKSIQAKGIVPDIWLDETAEGNVFAALRTREADLEKHLTGKEEKKDEARDKAREEARKKLEEQFAKSKEPPKPLPEFGSTEDFPLQQALNHLMKKPVMVSKTAIERKAEAAAD
ncbi:hypothetical protein B566_EDAN018981 [Ephemera danica]|nr:hypothetical protein B566_EDAN018981 [Ephemera danica]